MKDMKCAVMQPTYLPWAGYFNLIESADQFFYLDNAQYERGSWQHRNRILMNDKENIECIILKIVDQNLM